MKNKLYVGNLPLVTEVAQLQALFGADGRQVLSVKIVANRKTGHAVSFAFVEMGCSEQALSAIDALNGKTFMGRPMSVDMAQDPEALKKLQDKKRTRGRRSSHYF